MYVSIRTALVVAAIAVLGAATTGSAAAAPQNTQPLPANPELVDAIAKEIGSTPEQASGAAGSLFGVAKSRLKPEEFGQVSKAVP